MLNQRSTYQESLQFFAQITEAVEKHYSFGPCFLSVFVPGLIYECFLFTLQYSLALFDIYFSDCNTFDCYKAQALKNMKGTIYFYSFYPIVCAYCYVIVRKYNQLFELKSQNIRTTWNMAILSLGIVLIPIAGILIVMLENKLERKSNYFCDLALAYILISFLAYPRRITANITLANAPSIMLSYYVIKVCIKLNS